MIRIGVVLAAVLANPRFVSARQKSRFHNLFSRSAFGPRNQSKNRLAGCRFFLQLYFMATCLVPSFPEQSATHTCQIESIMDSIAQEMRTSREEKLRQQFLPPTEGHSEKNWS